MDGDCIDAVFDKIMYEKIADLHFDKKHDQDKLRYDLLPPEWMAGVAEVATMGAKKYSPNSWQGVPDGINRYYAAALRHIQAWRFGEEIDRESGVSHLYHCAWNVLALAWLDKNVCNRIHEGETNEAT